MFNLTSGQQNQWTTQNNHFVLRGGGGGGQCDELVFIVEAETTLGSSGTNVRTGGFPKGTLILEINCIMYLTSHAG